MTYTFNQKDLENVVIGACFLASGGGGALSEGKKIIDNIMEFSKTIAVVDHTEVKDNELSTVVAGVGSPEAGEKSIFKHSPRTAFDAMANSIQKSISHVLPVEIGAVNTLAPMLVAAGNNISIVDGDGAGRAVPQMEMTTYATQNVSVFLSTLANEKGYSMTVLAENAQDLEIKVRKIISDCEKFKDTAAIVTWVMDGKKLKKPGTIIPHTLKLAKDVGTALKKDNPVEKVFKVLDMHNLCYWLITKGKVAKVESKEKGGFDYGRAIIEGDKRVVLDFVNESLAAVIDSGHVVLAPHSICCMTLDGTPLSNADLLDMYKKGETPDVALIGIEARSELQTPAIVKSFVDLVEKVFVKD
ncbi:MAG: DUF917 domain-containing protein [Candidatus Methanofastidiosia archaeon]|jgi:DUF917 family protein